MGRNGALSIEEWQPLRPPLWVHSTNLLNRIWHLLRQWWPNVRKVLPAGSAKRPIVGSSDCKAQTPIGSAEHFICVIFVLPIVFPEAYSADFIVASFTERLEAAARTSKWKIADLSHAV
jgi:hypothetical protein